MYAYIKGELAYKGLDHVVVEAAGVGYRLLVSGTTLETLPKEGGTAKLLTHLHVREDAMVLFGFATREEQQLFEMLISVSGVGPKVALSLLSAVSPSRFSLAVVTDDAKALSKAPGVGAKTAQRIILELKDKIKKEQLSAPLLRTTEIPEAEMPQNVVGEAVSALMVLGYSQAESYRTVSQISMKGEPVLEDLIRQALKLLAKFS